MLSTQYQGSWEPEGTFDLLTDIWAINLHLWEFYSMGKTSPFTFMEKGFLQEQTPPWRTAAKTPSHAGKKNHATWVRRHISGSPTRPLYSEQRHLPLNQVTQSPIQHHLGWFQKRKCRRARDHTLSPNYFQSESLKRVKSMLGLSFQFPEWPPWTKLSVTHPGDPPISQGSGFPSLIQH